MKWKVKAFAELNKVSVRTLHHYDAIGLLKPSIRGDNGYRFYTESDFQKMQKILFLKDSEGQRATSLDNLSYYLNKIEENEKKGLSEYNVGFLKAHKDWLDIKFRHLNKAIHLLNMLIEGGATEESWNAATKLWEKYSMEGVSQ
jgi:DNA-binding transcriptional MerR regulator